MRAVVPEAKTNTKTNTVCICEQVFLGEDRLDLFREFFGFLKIFDCLTGVTDGVGGGGGGGGGGVGGQRRQQQQGVEQGQGQQGQGQQGQQGRQGQGHGEG